MVPARNSLPEGGSCSECRSWVKTGNPRTEHKWSALHPITTKTGVLSADLWGRGNPETNAVAGEPPRLALPHTILAREDPLMNLDFCQTD